METSPRSHGRPNTALRLGKLDVVDISLYRSVTRNLRTLKRVFLVPMTTFS